MQEVALVLAWLAIAWLAITLAATRRQVASLLANRSPRPAGIRPGDAGGIACPFVAVLVRPSCVSCDRVLKQLDVAAPDAAAVQVVTAAPDLVASNPRVTLAPSLVNALRPPAYPWVVAVDASYRIVEFEPYLSPARTSEILTELQHHTLAGLTQGGHR